MPPVDPQPDLPAPTATGTLVKRPLAHLLVYAHNRELSGTFEFVGPAGQRATVLFIEGQPTKARTSLANIFLGRVLVELGILTEEQLQTLLPRLLPSGELHGQVLTREGLITDEQLELALRAQLVRQMQVLVHLPPETTFRYFDGFDALASYGGDGHVGIDPFPVVWACLRDEPPWEHVQLGLAGVGGAGLQLSMASETSRFAFDKAERATVDLLRQRPWRIHDLTHAGTIAPRLAQLIVYCLLVTKQVELVRESQLPEAPPAEDSTPDEPPSSPFAANVIDPALAPIPRKVARVQLAQRSVNRSPPVFFEEDSSTWQVTHEKDDGKTSYVATQPRTIKKRANVSAEGAGREGAGEVAAEKAPDARPVTPTLAPPAIHASRPSEAFDDDIFHIPTPSVGMQAIDPAAFGPAGAPPWRGAPSEEVHTRPTVPKMAAVTPEQIALHVASPAQKPPQSLSIATPLSSRVPEASPSSGTSGTSGTRGEALPKADGGRALASPDLAETPPPSLAAATPPSSGSQTSTEAPLMLEEDDALDESDGSDALLSNLEEQNPMSDELAARRKEIQDRAGSIDKDDYFAALGVKRDTPSSEVQKAFFGLAKKWHPDRVPSALADVKDLCAKVFARMSEAHQTLMDPAKRAKYEAARKPGGDDSPEAQAQVIAILEAATNFQKAEICLKRNDFKQAQDFCRKAIEVEPKQADYIAMMAWLEAQKPAFQHPAATQAQVQELTRAIGFSQACERAFFYRAMLLKKLGQEPAAMKDFKRAMELNPRNVDAQRELRLYTMRGGDKARGGSTAPPGTKPKEEGGGGIFARLFKK